MEAVRRAFRPGPGRGPLLPGAAREGAVIRALAALPLLIGLLLVGTACPQVWAQEENDHEVDDALAGFDEEDDLEAAVPKTRDHSRRLRLGGSLGLGASYNFAHPKPAAGQTDWRGLSRLRLTLGLEAELRLAREWRIFVSGSGDYDFAYWINGKDQYTGEVLEAYEYELELEESFITGRIGRHLDLCFGRQIVGWGTSETLRVVDVLNPLDLREPGLTDIDELRLPVVMSRLGYGLGRWQLDAMVMHEIRFDKNPAFGNDFYPTLVPLPEEEVPSSKLENSEYAASLSAAFRGWDFSLHWAEVWNDQAHVELVSLWQPRLVHNRITMYGATWDLAAGDLLFKGEAAHFRGIEFFAAPDQRFSRTELLVGVEFSGLNDTWMVLEVVGRHLHDFEPALALPPESADEDQLDWALRLTHALLNQTLNLSVVVLCLGADGDGGGITRFEARYDVSDRLELLGGVVLYRSGDRFGFENVGDNDRFFLEVQYRF